MTIPKRIDSPLITEDTLSLCRNDLIALYKGGFVKAGDLSHQTEDVLFSETLNPFWGNHWDTLRQTFIDVAKQCVSGNFLVKAWCFASFPKIKNKQWEWHNHPNATYSAVLYVSLPKDEMGNCCFTTEFLQEDGKSVFVEPKLGSWFLFPGEAVHRNGFWDYESMTDVRLCVAASALKNSEQVSH